jgi:hypothetical protein
MRDALRSNRFWIIGGYVCLLATAALGFRSLRATPADLPQMPSMLAAGDSSSAPAVAVVFRLEDCSGSIERLAAWGGLSDAGTARVYGFVVDPPGDDAEVRRILDGSGIRFPVLAAQDRYFPRVLGALGFERTPVVLLFDREGRVRMAMPLDGRSGAEDVQRAAAVIRGQAPAADGRTS